MVFCLEEKNLIVDIRSEPILIIEQCIKEAGVLETGGVLIGYYSPDLTTAVITKATTPPDDSASGRYWFKRGIKGLKKLFKKAWKDHEYYLGEWHFHPLGTISPSFQDLNQMKSIVNAQDYQCPEAIMIIIAGSSHNYLIQPYITFKSDGKTSPLTQIK